MPCIKYKTYYNQPVKRNQVQIFMRNLSLYRMIKEENHAENNQGYDYRRYFKNGS